MIEKYQGIQCRCTMQTKTENECRISTEKTILYVMCWILDDNKIDLMTMVALWIEIEINHGHIFATLQH